MNMLGHRLCIACVAILSALAFAQSSGAEPLIAPPANGLVRVSPKLKPPRVAPPESLAIQGISTLGNEPIALLSVKHPRPNPRPTAIEFGLELGQWLAAGDSSLFSGYTVRAIAKDHVILVRNDTGEKIRIPLASAPVTTSGLKPYSKAWINSRANPMLFHTQDMPGKMFGGAWDKLTRKKKAQVLEFYRKHGWQLIPARTGLGPTQFKWRNLHAAERAAAIEANRENFARTLTPEQLGLWKQMRGFQFIYAEGGRHTDAQRELIAARQRIIDEFKKSLTPEQEAEHDSI